MINLSVSHIFELILSILICVIMMTMLGGGTFAFHRFFELVAAHTDLAVLTLSQRLGISTLERGTLLLNSGAWTNSCPWVLSGALIWHILFYIFKISLLSTLFEAFVLIFLVLMDNISNLWSLQFFVWHGLGLLRVRASWSHHDWARLRRVFILLSPFVAAIGTG